MFACWMLKIFQEPFQSGRAIVSWKARMHPSYDPLKRKYLILKSKVKLFTRSISKIFDVIKTPGKSKPGKGVKWDWLTASGNLFLFLAPCPDCWFWFC